MIPRRPHQPEEGTDAWLMSYADMITLLMCFFIVFVSVSEPKKDKFSYLTQGLANKFGSIDMSTPFAGLFSSLQATVETNQVFRDVAIEKTDRSVEVELASRAFYKNNSIEFDEKNLAVLTEMAAAMKKIDFLDYRIVIEGYTNDEPVSSPVYPSNWELSSARSARMARFFIEHGVEPHRLKAVGFGDSAPKVPNTDASGNPIPENQEKNQRMVIKIERVL